MRIGVFTPFFPQRSETFVIDQIADLMEAGHEVRIFCLSGARTGRDHPAVLEHDLLDRVVHLMSPDRHRRDKILRAAGRAIRYLPGSVLRLRHLRDEDIGRGMKVPAAAAAMGLLAEVPSPPLGLDVLQVHFGPMGIVVDALREMGVVAGPMVVSFHGSDVSAWPRGDPDRYRGLFARADALTANSRFLRDRLLGLGAAAERTSLIPMGVDLETFSYRVPPGGPPRFLSVGRLSREKGVEHAVRAMGVLRDRGRVFSYTIIGDGPLRPEIEALTRSLKIDDRVRVRGAEPRDVVVAAMADHHVFVQPSIRAESGAVEAQGLALVEAQATGMPVVASAVGGIPETVGEGAGRLVPAGDPVALADALDELLSERDSWSDMGAAGRRHVERSFDRRAITGTLTRLYASLIDDR